MNKNIQISIPSLQELYDSLPDECKDKYVKLHFDNSYESIILYFLSNSGSWRGEVANDVSMYTALQHHYNRIIAMMINECNNAIEPVVYMGLFENSGNQRICNWSANDNNRLDTSRWLYAGCLVYDVEHNNFSIHA